MLAAITAHFITASADLGYIDKSVAMTLMRDATVYVKSMYGGHGSFRQYGSDFLDGENAVKLNKKGNHKKLEQHVADLNLKAGSPWNNLEFNSDDDELFDFDHMISISTEDCTGSNDSNVINIVDISRIIP